MQRAATSPQDGAETAVIDDDLIAQSLVEEGSMTSKTSVALAEVTADAQTLRLSFKNIFCIDNLQGFNALTKLCLDNNIICAIENLDHLVNLQWLDLSFNNITKISGLDKLTKLTDVSLFSNMIGEIEGLDRCTDLQCLSLGNNRIVSLDSVQRLRKFKSLRLLNLEGNPVSKESEFRMYILAYLNGLTYLDYAMVVKSDVLTAREQYQDELLDLQEKEDLEDEKAAREQAAAKQTEKYKAANLVVVETIFAEMFAEDTENLKLKFLPGINDIVSNFQSEVEAASDKFLKDGLAKDEHKRDERAIFSEALHSLRASYEADSVGIIEAFNRRKKSDSRAFAGRDAVEASEVEPLVKELDSVQMKLMDLEMRQVEQFEDIMSEFDTKYVWGGRCCCCCCMLLLHAAAACCCCARPDDAPADLPPPLLHCCCCCCRCCYCYYHSLTHPLSGTARSTPACSRRSSCTSAAWRTARTRTPSACSSSSRTCSTRPAATSSARRCRRRPRTCSSTATRATTPLTDRTTSTSASCTSARRSASSSRCSTATTPSGPSATRSTTATGPASPRSKTSSLPTSASSPTSSATSRSTRTTSREGVLAGGLWCCVL